MIATDLRIAAGASLAAALMLAGCATGDIGDYIPDVDADFGFDHVDIVSETDTGGGDVPIDVPMDDIAVDDPAADDLSIDDVTVDDFGIDDFIADDVTLDDVAIDDVTIDDITIDDVAIDDTILDDPGIDDVAIDDVAMDDLSIDDPVTEDASFSDTAADDPAWDDAPISGTLFGTDTFGYQGFYSTPAVLGCDDIGSTGTFLLASDDSHARTPVGFSFDFYGTTYTDVSVGSNGHIYFIDVYLGLGNVCLPGDPGYSGIVTFIAGFWTDLYQEAAMGRGIWIQTLGTAPDRRFVVQWLSDFCCSTMADGIKFQIVLFEGSNDIRVCYVDTSNGSGSDFGADATSGIQESLSRSIQYSCNAASLTPGLQLDYLHP